MSLTVMTECSHLNNSEFIEQGKGHAFYRLGGFSQSENITLIIFDCWKSELPKGYRFVYFSYNNNTNLDSWGQPLEFFLENLASPFATDDISAPSSLTVIFNSLYSLKAAYANADPFFLTAPTRDDSGFYAAGQPVATLVCRDRIQLTVDSGTSVPRFLATGTVSDISKMWSSYMAMQPNSQELIDLHSDYALLTVPLYPSVIRQTLRGLSATVLNAQNSIHFSGIQYGLSENLTTRREVTRWFGVILLDILYMANTLTSGTDNNMGLGINRYEDSTWFCDNTLRYVSTYVSIKVLDLLVILLLVGGITIVSYALPRCLYLFIRSMGQQDNWWRRIGAPLIAFTLHDVMHLYRVALKETTGQDLKGTLSPMPIFEGMNRRDGGRAPYYGIAAWDYHRLLRGDNKAQSREDVELQGVRGQATSNGDTTSHDRENTELPDEGAENGDDIAISATAEATDEITIRTDTSVDSDLGSDVDDEVDASPGHRPYVATMQRDPGRTDVDLDDVQ